MIKRISYHFGSWFYLDHISMLLSSDKEQRRLIMKNLNSKIAVNVTNHVLTPAQVATFGGVVDLPSGLKTRFSQVTPDQVDELAVDLLTVLSGATTPGHVIIIQGHPGLTFKLITGLKELGAVCVYAHSPRKSIEVDDPVTGETVTKKSEFTFEKWVEY